MPDIIYPKSGFGPAGASVVSGGGLWRWAASHTNVCVIVFYFCNIQQNEAMTPLHCHSVCYTCASYIVLSSVWSPVCNIKADYHSCRNHVSKRWEPVCSPAVSLLNCMLTYQPHCDHQGFLTQLIYISSSSSLNMSVRCSAGSIDRTNWPADWEGPLQSTPRITSRTDVMVSFTCKENQTGLIIALCHRKGLVPLIEHFNFETF